MYRIPNQFDPRAQATLSAAGGGSTSTTCSSCIVTIGVATVVPAVLFANLAAAPSPALPSTQGVAPRAPMSKGHAIGLALLVPLCLLLAVAAAYFEVGLGAGVSVLLMAALGGWVAIFGYVYGRTQGKSGKGIGIGVLVLIGLVAMAAFEMFFWIK